MIDYDSLYNDVKAMISAKRLKHSEGVVKRAIEYAKIYNIDIETVKLTAIAHDIAKELSLEDEKKYIKEYNIELDEIEKISHNLLHAIIGAYICKNKYNFTNDMVNAIKYHTTGRENMSILEKIIYLADATDENRNYSDLNYYVDIIKNNIDKGMVEVSKWVINKLVTDEKIIHTNTIKCYNYYLKK